MVTSGGEADVYLVLVVTDKTKGSAGQAGLTPLAPKRCVAARHATPKARLSPPGRDPAGCGGAAGPLVGRISLMQNPGLTDEKTVEAGDQDNKGRMDFRK